MAIVDGDGVCGVQMEPLAPTTNCSEALIWLHRATLLGDLDELMHGEGGVIGLVEASSLDVLVDGVHEDHAVRLENVRAQARADGHGLVLVKQVV